MCSLKQTIIIFVFLFIGMLKPSLAQSYLSMTVDSSTRTFSGFEKYIEFRAKLRNSSGSFKQYSWTRTDLCPMPSGWSALVCDCDACYPPSVYTKPISDIVVDSCTFLFTYSFDFGASMGSHTTKLDFYNPLDSINTNGTTIFNINLGCSVLGLPSFNQSEISIYPTLVTDKVNISTSGDANEYSIKLLSIDGSEMRSLLLPVSQTEYQIDMSSFSSGLYVALIRDERGYTVSKIKLIKH